MEGSLRDNVSWRVRDGKGVHFWDHNWVPSLGTLGSHPWASGWRGYPFQRVADFVMRDGSWNVGLLHQWVPPLVLQRIMAVPALDPVSSHDSIACMHSSNGVFFYGLDV